MRKFVRDAKGRFAGSGSKRKAYRADKKKAKIAKRSRNARADARWNKEYSKAVSNPSAIDQKLGATIAASNRLYKDDIRKAKARKKGIM